MEPNGLFCTYCKNRYDQENHVPRIFPFCGHTFCTQCFDIFLQQSPHNQILCPIDKTSHFVQNKVPTVFPINYMLKSLVELNKTKWSMCQDHNKEIEFICMNDRLRICGECAIMKLHHGHEIRLMDQFYSEITEKTNTLELKLAQINMYEREFNGMLEIEKETMIISLRSKFEILGKILKIKEEELVNEITKFFDQEKYLLEKQIGPESSLKKKLEQSLAVLKEKSLEINLIDILEDKSPELSSLGENNSIETCQRESYEKLKQTSKFLNGFIDHQIQSIQQLSFPLKNRSLINV